MLANSPDTTYINTQRQLKYRLSSINDNTHICDLNFDIENIDLKPLVGNVEVSCTYTTPTGGTWTDHLGFDWTYHQVYGFKTTIQDFFLPIKGQGIGKFIFYVVCSNLPVVEHRTLHIAGRLVTQDSSKLRDEFWKKIIDFGRDNRSKFKVDEHGNGYFSGYLSLARISAHPKLLISLLGTGSSEIL